MSRQHRELAEGRWNALSLVEQLANVGSEVERVLRWQEKGNTDYAMKAMDRALELFELTLACPEISRNQELTQGGEPSRAEKRDGSEPGSFENTARLREVARAREVVLDFVFGENAYGSTADSLRRYFYAFGVAARAAHAKRTIAT